MITRKLINLVLLYIKMPSSTADASAAVAMLLVISLLV